MDITDRDLFEVGDLGHFAAPEDQGQGNSVLGDQAPSGRKPCGLSGWFGNGCFHSVYQLTPPLGARLR